MKIAVARPAAPAPTIATSNEVELRPAVYAALDAVAGASSRIELAASSFTKTVEMAPQVLHRTVRFVGSSDVPMISVRWLPHFGQTGRAAGYG